MVFIHNVLIVWECVIFFNLTYKEWVSIITLYSGTTLCSSSNKSSLRVSKRKSWKIIFEVCLHCNWVVVLNKLLIMTCLSQIQHSIVGIYIVWHGGKHNELDQKCYNILNHIFYNMSKNSINMLLKLDICSQWPTLLC